MAKSPFFARIRSEVLAVLVDLPTDRLTTFAAIGSVLAVPARHVAYILSQLEGPERDVVRWWQVLGDGGVVSRTDPSRAESQIEALRLAGFGVQAGRVIGFEDVFLVPPLPPGALGERPPDAPSGTPPKKRPPRLRV